jgi:hypothetical protein
MLSAPYSIYVNKRPLRIAFLIEDKPKSLAIIDTILAYNRDRWGGRYNPIVTTDGQTLTDPWWSLLEAVDPDVVKLFVPLTDDLVGLIERRVSPYLIQQPDRREQEEEHQHVRLLHDGLSLLPTALNARMASWAIGELSLVLFETDWKKREGAARRSRYRRHPRRSVRDRRGEAVSGPLRRGDLRQDGRNLAAATPGCSSVRLDGSRAECADHHGDRTAVGGATASEHRRSVVPAS